MEVSSNNYIYGSLVQLRKVIWAGDRRLRQLQRILVTIGLGILEHTIKSFC